ncbi:MAG: dihydroorotate dehydrogenase [Thermoproteota archaeon]
MRNDGVNVNLAGLRLSNPTMLASGILGLSAEYLRDIVEGGAGGIVTKSIGLKPRKGYVNPTIVQGKCGLINAMGLPNPGIREFVNEIQEMKALGVPIIVSVYGFSAKDYAVTAKKAVEAGADGVELNVSCPHVEDTGSEIGQNPEFLAEVVKKVKKNVEKPVLVKLSPNVTDIVKTAEAAADSGADALTAINTVRGMAIDTETAMPILSHRIGGLSGAGIKPIAVRCIYEIYQRVPLPLVGCGGVNNWRDAVEFLLAGATAVQIGTAIAQKGIQVFKDVAKGIESYLEMKGFDQVEEIVGLSHRS